MKYTEHEKIEAVKRVIEDHQSIGSSARAIGMSPTLNIFGFGLDFGAHHRQDTH